MHFRSNSDRTISTYGAILVITIIGAGATMLIVRTANNIADKADASNSTISSLEHSIPGGTKGI